MMHGFTVMMLIALCLRRLAAACGSQRQAASGRPRYGLATTVQRFVLRERSVSATRSIVTVSESLTIPFARDAGTAASVSSQTVFQKELQYRRTSVSARVLALSQPHHHGINTLLDVATQ